MGEAPAVAAGTDAKGPRGRIGLWGQVIERCDSCSSVSLKLSWLSQGTYMFPIFTPSDPRHPVMTGPIRTNSASSPYLVPQILRLTVHDGYLDWFCRTGGRSALFGHSSLRYIKALYHSQSPALFPESLLWGGDRTLGGC